MSSKKDKFPGLLRADTDTGLRQKERVLQILPAGYQISTSEIMPGQHEQNPREPLSHSAPLHPELDEGKRPAPLEPDFYDNQDSSNHINDEDNSTNNIDDNKKKSGSEVLTNASHSDDPIKAQAAGSLDSLNIREILQSSLPGLNESSVEETHTRKTYLIDNELLKDFDEICVGRKKGFRTKVINAALKLMLDMIKENNEKLKL